MKKPQIAILKEKKIFTPNLAWFRLKLKEKPDKLPWFVPGQFLILGVPGAEEAPFGFVSSPYQKEVEILVKKKGKLTSALFEKKPDDILTILAPLGRGFPIKRMKEKDILIFAGGVGAAPMFGLLEYLAKNKEDFDRVYFFWGAKTPQEIVLKEKLKKFEKFAKIILVVENPLSGWQGRVGYCQDYLSEAVINPTKTIAILCGPPVMYQFVVKALKKKKIKQNNIFLLLENKMRCGQGLCQQCVIGPYYVCQDGPVFSWEKIEKYFPKSQ